MNKTVWSIFIFGAMGVFILTMLMCMTLDTFQQSPASKNTKLAQNIRRRFGLQSAGTVVRDEVKKKVLRVIYQTTKDSKFDISAQNAEMEEIALYAYKHYESRRKQEIEVIRVTRHELRGSGCWQRTYTSNFEMDRPADDTIRELMQRAREAEPPER